MSLFGSLFSGVSGLAAQSQSMGMISDNISNVNTIAYKGAVADFSTLVTRSASASRYSPGGVQAATVSNITGQGLIQNSSSATDIAIDGNGFFVVNSQADAAGERLYTRAGSFKPDVLGNLRNAAGFYLQGWPLDSDGAVANVNNLRTVNVREVGGLASATTRVDLGANLDVGQAAFTGTYAVGALAAYNASGGISGVEPHFTRDVEIYDSLGRPHNITLAFLRDPAANTWNVEAYAPSADVETGDHANGLIASGQVVFNGDGTLASTTLTPLYPTTSAGDPIGINWLDTGGAQDSTLTFGLGTSGLGDGLVQFYSDYNVSFVTQNGAEFSELTGVRITDEGFVLAAFSNGQERRLYKLPLATFDNPLALASRTGNVYAQTDASGMANLREVGDGGAGKITPSALEGANVDLADEFTKMIVTQRAYSANAKVITTTDEMLDELIRIRR
jgi:flagellar hook protein FlgE